MLMRRIVLTLLSVSVAMAGGTGNPVEGRDLQSNRFDEVKELVLSLEADFVKFYEKGNQAAGTRVRKGMQDLKNLAQDIRVEVQQIKNNPN